MRAWVVPPFSEAPRGMPQVQVGELGQKGRRLGMAKHKLGVYGAWLFKGQWDGKSAPPQEGWELLKVVPGRFTDAPEGLEPGPGQVLMLGQGAHTMVITPE